MTTDRPCDTEDHDNVIPLRPRLRLVKVFGSDVRDAQTQHDFNMELAKLNVHSSDAGSYDPLKTDDDGGDAA